MPEKGNRECRNRAGTGAQIDGNGFDDESVHGPSREEEQEHGETETNHGQGGIFRSEGEHDYWDGNEHRPSQEQSITRTISLMPGAGSESPEERSEETRAS